MTPFSPQLAEYETSSEEEEVRFDVFKTKWMARSRASKWSRGGPGGSSWTPSGPSYTLHTVCMEYSVCM
jgi:hypothetical protein